MTTLVEEVGEYKPPLSLPNPHFSFLLTLETYRKYLTQYHLLTDL